MHFLNQHKIPAHSPLWQVVSGFPWYPGKHEQTGLDAVVKHWVFTPHGFGWQGSGIAAADANNRHILKNMYFIYNLKKKKKICQPSVFRKCIIMTPPPQRMNYCHLSNLFLFFDWFFFKKKNLNDKRIKFTKLTETGFKKKFFLNRKTFVTYTWSLRLLCHLDEVTSFCQNKQVWRQYVTCQIPREYLGVPVYRSWKYFFIFEWYISTLKWNCNIVPSILYKFWYLIIL